MNQAAAINPRGPHLTQARLRAIRLLCAGRTLNEIADELAVSPETVRRRFFELRLIFGAKTNAQLAATAVRLGVV